MTYKNFKVYNFIITKFKNTHKKDIHSKKFWLFKNIKSDTKNYTFKSISYFGF